MNGEYDYTGYEWIDTKTCSYNYLYQLILKIIEKIGLETDSKILDAGCGGGQLIYDLYKIGYLNIYGFDASLSAIEIAKKNFVEIESKYFVHNAFEKMLPGNMPIEYDLIISMEVIEHLFNPKIYLNNIYTWLSRDGYLILTTPYHGWLKNLVIVLLNRFDKHFDPLSEHGHIKFFSTKTIKKLLNQIGFRVINFYGAGRLPFFWKSMIFLAQKGR